MDLARPPALCQCTSTMEQTLQETSPVRTNVRAGRRASTTLGGLPRSAFAAVVVVTTLVVSLGGLARAGVLGPSFRSTGGGTSSTVNGLTAGAPVVSFDMLLNVSWRSWDVTAIETAGTPRRDIRAFVRPVDTSVDIIAQIEAAAADPGLTRLPVTVPRGSELVMVEIRGYTGCPLTQATAGPGPARTALVINTPLGERRFRTTLFRGAPPIAPVDGCA